MIKLSPTWQYRCGILALVLYNAWVLGVIINPHATFAGATTSELQVWGQPGALFFRLTDGISGLLFLASSGAVIGLGGSKGSKKARLLLGVGLVSLGVSTILETLIALDCSSALDALCAQREQLNALSWQHNFHIFESSAAYALMLLLPVGGLLAVRRTPASTAVRFKRWSWTLIVFIALWGVETAIRFSHHAASYGLEQRLFDVVFMLWYLQALRLAKATPAGATDDS